MNKKIEDLNEVSDIDGVTIRQFSNSYAILNAFEDKSNQVVLKEALIFVTC